MLLDLLDKIPINLQISSEMVGKFILPLYPVSVVASSKLSTTLFFLGVFIGVGWGESRLGMELK